MYCLVCACKYIEFTFCRDFLDRYCDIWYWLEFIVFQYEVNKNADTQQTLEISE